MAIITRSLTNEASASTASNIELGSCVTEIGQGAFSGYTNITEVEFPDSLTTIGDGAFRGSSITTVEIPSGVASIGYNAFKDCSNLDRVDINATTPPSLGSDAFDNTNNCPIYVPFTSYSDYKTAEDWVEYASRIRYEGAPYKVKFIDTNGEETFINCDSSSSVSKPSPMPSGILTTIFGECIEEIGNFSASTLGDVFISSSVKTIGQYAFMNCTVNSISFSEGLETIEGYAFAGLNARINISLPTTIKTINGNAFNSYTNITGLTINGSSTLELWFDSLSLNILNVSNIKSIKRAINVQTAIIKNVEVINNSAFYASNLSEIFISTTGSTIIGHNAFVRCRLTSIEIPNGVTSIGSGAFSECTELTNIILGNGITIINDGTFSGCTKLASVNIPNSVTSIGSSAFYGCRSLTSVTIGNSVTSIGDSAFYQCSGLTSINIPNSVTSIGYSAFYGCRSLTSVNIPSSVVNIGESGFTSCNHLSSITVNRATPPSLGIGAFDNTNCPIYVPQESYNLYINAENWSAYASRIHYIGEPYKLKYKAGLEYGVVTCNDNTILSSSEIPNLTSVADIGSCVTTIGASAFGSRRYLTSVTIGNSVTSIGENAFNGTPWWNAYSADASHHYGNIIYINNVAYQATATTITSCTFREGTVSISNYAFRGCSGLTSVSIPNSVTSIGSSAFYDCRSLTSLTIGNSVTSIGDYAFNYCSGLTSVSIPNSVTSIGSRAFQSCYSLTSIDIPNSVTSIGEAAFLSCSSLSSVTIPSSVTSISNYAFSHCTKLTSIVIPNSVTSIGGSAFDSCTSLTSVNIPNSVTSIGASAFNDCTSLTSIDIPSSVTSIGSEAFRYSSKVESVTVNATTPPSLGSSAFNNMNNCPIYVPSASVDAYKAATNWSTYASRIQAIPNS